MLLMLIGILQFSSKEAVSEQLQFNPKYIKSMTKSILLNCFLGLFLLSANRSHASTVLIDSFVEGSFRLDGPPADSPISNYSPIESPLAGSRGVVIRGGGAWSSILNTSSGTMSYDVRNSLAEPVGQSLFLTYYAKSGQKIDLLGQNGFLLKFSSLTGEGDLGITVNGNLSLMRLTGPGEVLWNYSNIPIDLHLNQINISFTARTEDFSFILDEIAVVPEPTSLAFCSVALSGFIARRRRQ
jgi:hypothetical protein